MGGEGEVPSKELYENKMNKGFFLVRKYSVCSFMFTSWLPDGVRRCTQRWNGLGFQIDTFPAISLIQAL